ncbi:arylesterase [Alphaproteobacteria bacterium KMM 3653]|uniref:Arylesterase n=1 Tax=Harenicola maris TaxID=2841044 RepID=A0AAP2CPS9_9RHOB|nr:arylesterase [Harenicola maris]
MSRSLRRTFAANGPLQRALRAGALFIATLTGPLWAEPVTIAAMGDSLTQGYGLPLDKGFVPQLEAWLKANGHDVAVVNAGVSGDTTAGGLARTGWTLTPDVDAMILALGGNDMLRGIDPAVTRANLDGILTQAGAAGVPVLLIGLPAPGNFGPDYAQEFNAIFPELAEKHGALYAPNFLGGLMGREAEISSLMQGDGIHPSAKGVALIVEDLGPEVAKLAATVDQGS